MSSILKATSLTTRNAGSGISRIQFLVFDYANKLTSFTSLDKGSTKMEILFQCVIQPLSYIIKETNLLQ